MKQKTYKYDKSKNSNMEDDPFGTTDEEHLEQPCYEREKRGKLVSKFATLL